MSRHESRENLTTMESKIPAESSGTVSVARDAKNKVGPSGWDSSDVIQSVKPGTYSSRAGDIAQAIMPAAARTHRPATPHTVG